MFLHTNLIILGGLSFSIQIFAFGEWLWLWLTHAEDEVMLYLKSALNEHNESEVAWLWAFLPGKSTDAW